MGKIDEITVERVKKVIKKHSNIIIDSEIDRESSMVYIGLIISVSIKDVVNLLNDLPRFDEIFYVGDDKNIILQLFYD